MFGVSFAHLRELALLTNYSLADLSGTVVSDDNCFFGVLRARLTQN